jgi:hypothetical protein
VNGVSWLRGALVQERATSLGLGGASFIHYQPPALSGDNGPFDPSLNAAG